MAAGTEGLHARLGAVGSIDAVMFGRDVIDVSGWLTAVGTRGVIGEEGGADLLPTAAVASPGRTLAVGLVDTDCGLVAAGFPRHDFLRLV